MTKIKIITMIQSQIGNLTKIETMIADYILNFPDCILENNITEMALKMDVSRNAITRFCKRFGFNGYTDFKYEYTRQIHHLQQQTLITNDIATIISQNLDKLTTTSLEKKLQAVAKQMYTHKQVKIIAIGKSRVAASYLKYNLQTFNKYIEIIDEVTYGGELSYIFNEEDYVLVFSVGARSNISNQLIVAAMTKTKQLDIFTMNKNFAQHHDFVTLLPNIEKKLPYKLHNQLIFFVVIDMILNFYALL